jgi:hypothetical protein
LLKKKVNLRDLLTIEIALRAQLNKHYVGSFLADLFRKPAAHKGRHNLRNYFDVVFLKLPHFFNYCPTTIEFVSQVF